MGLGTQWARGIIPHPPPPQGFKLRAREKIWPLFSIFLWQTRARFPTVENRIILQKGNGWNRKCKEWIEYKNWGQREKGRKRRYTKAAWTWANNFIWCWIKNKGFEMATHSSVLAWRIPGMVKDKEVWRAAVYGVAQSWTRLKWLSSSSRVSVQFSRSVVSNSLWPPWAPL